MSLFCGDKCKCKNQCKADLGWNKQAMKGCQAACKTNNPPANGFDYMERFPDEFEDYYTAEIELASALTNTDASGSAGSRNTLFLVVGFLVIIGLAWYFFIRK